MEIEESERIVIARPIPSRPSCSNLRPCSDLFAVRVNGTLLAQPAETPSIIRPKTIRLKPPVAQLMRDAELSLDDLTVSDIFLSPDRKDGGSTIVYKPVAKLVSRVAAPVVLNMGAHAECPAHIPQQTQVTHQTESHYKSSLPTSHEISTSQLEAKTAATSSQSEFLNVERKLRSQNLITSSDKISFDGYNWRKYGQKQVKGSEYPRSYYKCTHPNCLVKKKVERSLDGQIAEIVYNGEHNHPKPQPSKRPHGKNVLVDGGRSDLLSTSSLVEMNNELYDKAETSNAFGIPLTPTYGGNLLFPYDCGVGVPDTPFGIPSVYGDKETKFDEDHGSPFKRRKNDDQDGSTIIPTRVSEPSFMIQTSAESDGSSDGFRWRKYGQKVVKGNPYPRSYYKCTNLDCNVRKHIERSLDDPRSVVTTYEGKHNHEMPVRIPNQIARDTGFNALAFKNML